MLSLTVEINGLLENRESVNRNVEMVCTIPNVTT